MAAAEAEGAQVTPVHVDLRDASGVQTFHDALAHDGRSLEVLGLNAGIGQGGAFIETDIDDELSIVDLNITSTLRLAKLVLPEMVMQGSGRVLVTSSIASEMPGSFHAVYNASKSFLQSWTEALQNELKDSAVTPTALMPGPTETEFFERADMQDTKVGQSDKDDPATVARQGVDAVLAGKPPGDRRRADDADPGRREQGHARPGQGRHAPRHGGAWHRRLTALPCPSARSSFRSRR